MAEENAGQLYVKKEELWTSNDDVKSNLIKLGYKYISKNTLSTLDASPGGTIIKSVFFFPQPTTTTTAYLNVAQPEHGANDPNNKDGAQYKMIEKSSSPSDNNDKRKIHFADNPPRSTILESPRELYSIHLPQELNDDDYKRYLFPPLIGQLATSKTYKIDNVQGRVYRTIYRGGDGVKVYTYDAPHFYVFVPIAHIATQVTDESHLNDRIVDSINEAYHHEIDDDNQQQQSSRRGDEKKQQQLANPPSLLHKIKYLLKYHPSYTTTSKDGGGLDDDDDDSPLLLSSSSPAHKPTHEPSEYDLIKYLQKTDNAGKQEEGTATDEDDKKNAKKDAMNRLREESRKRHEEQSQVTPPTAGIERLSLNDTQELKEVAPELYGHTRWVSAVGPIAMARFGRDLLELFSRTKNSAPDDLKENPLVRNSLRGQTTTLVVFYDNNDVGNKRRLSQDLILVISTIAGLLDNPDLPILLVRAFLPSYNNKSRTHRISVKALPADVKNNYNRWALSVPRLGGREV